MIALIRIAGAEQFLYQSESSDGGATWAAPVRTPMWGYPCDLLLLDSGEVLCAYGYRRNPMGVRACLSCDGGRTWDIEHELVLRGDGFGGSDLGYPKVVQFSDGNILIVYYFTRCDGITHIRCARLRREHFGMRTQLAPDLVSDIALGTASSAHDPGGQALPSPDAVTDGRLDEASVWEWSGPEATIEFRFPWEQTIDTAELHAGRPGCGLHGWPQAVTWEGEGENGWQVLAEMAITGSDSVGPNGAVSCRFEAAVVKAVRLKLTARPASEGAEANIVREVVFRHTKAQEWVDQEHETGDSGWASLYGTAPRIQRFVPQKRTITAVGIRICHASRFYEPHECGVTVSVRNDPEGGQALATSSLDKDSIRAGWNIFKLDSPLEVEPGKPYWIEVKCTKPVAATARWVLTTGTDYKDGCLEGTEPEKSISIGFRTYYK